jgi:hypothetical protein
MRKANQTDLVGKTIQSIDNDSFNYLRLNFSDGTSLELWAEQAVHTSAGSIPGIFVEEDSNG